MWKHMYFVSSVNEVELIGLNLIYKSTESMKGRNWTAETAEID
jgi:hypothetical protein